MRKPSTSFKAWGGIFDADFLRRRIESLEKEIADPAFWSNSDKKNPVMKELKDLKGQIETLTLLEKEREELAGLLVITDEKDADSLRHLEEEAKSLEKKIDLLEFQKLLSGPNDKNSAILSINAGAGGTESCDWVSMLLRMYSRWSQSRGYGVQIIDILPGEEAGVKNVTLLIEGRHAYGYLKTENGVHRLVRISPFDSNKRRHTS